MECQCFIDKYLNGDQWNPDVVEVWEHNTQACIFLVHLLGFICLSSVQQLFKLKLWNASAVFEKIGDWTVYKMLSGWLKWYFTTSWKSSLAVIYL